MVEVASITMRDYEARNNETWRSALVLTNGNNVPVDLTGTEWAMHLRRSGRAPLDLDISTANGRIYLGDTTGSLAIEVAQADVAHLSGDYLYDLKETISQRIVQAGKITVTDGETREGDIYATA